MTFLAGDVAPWDIDALLANRGIAPGYAYLTTMTTSATGQANATALAADMVAASNAGKTLVIPPANYPFGGATQALASLTASLRVSADGAKLVVPSGNTTVPLRISTESLWADYVVSAFTQTAFGTDAAPDNLSVNVEFSTITLTSGPASMQIGEMFAIASNDMLDYGSETEGYELNFQTSIGEVANYSSGVIYTSGRLRRNFTPDNGTTRWCRLRRFNNKGIKLEIDGLVFTTNGDIYDPANAVRPFYVIEIVGFQAPVIGPKCRTEKAWAGDWVIKNTQDHVFQASSEDLPNSLNGVTALGYTPAFYGANLNSTVDRKTIKRGRHSTSIWNEAPLLALGTLTAGATTTFAYTQAAGSQGGTPQVGDMIYIEGLVGTISTLNGTWQTLTARTGNSTSGTLTFAFNSTGLARTSGGTAKMFEPDKAHEYYGEREGCKLEGGYVSGFFGAYIDEHQNDLFTVVDGLTATAASGQTWSTTEGRVINNRGINSRYANLTVSDYASIAEISSFAGQHGLPNRIVFDGGTFHRQSVRTKSASVISHLWETEGDATVTDQRELVIKDWSIFDAYSVVNHQANAGDVLIRNMHVGGDWGPGSGVSPSGAILNIAGGTMLVEDSLFDFTNATAAQIRVARILGGALTFRRCTFRNLFATSSQYPISMSTAAGTLSLEDCNIEFSSATSQRFCNVTVSGAVINIRGDNRVVGSTRQDTARGLFTNSISSGSMTINLAGEIRGDAAGMILSKPQSAGTTTLNDLRQTTPTAVT